MVSVTALPTDPIWYPIIAQLADHFTRSNLSVSGFHLSTLTPTVEYDSTPFLFMVGGNKSAAASQVLKPIECPTQLLHHNHFLKVAKEIRHPVLDVNLLLIGMLSTTAHLIYYISYYYELVVVVLRGHFLRLSVLEITYASPNEC